jgi:hypothetical protein
MAASAHRALGETRTKVRSRVAPIRERGEHVAEQEAKAIFIEPLFAAQGECSKWCLEVPRPWLPVASEGIWRR